MNPLKTVIEYLTRSGIPFVRHSPNHIQVGQATFTFDGNTLVLSRPGLPDRFFKPGQMNLDKLSMLLTHSPSQLAS